MTEDDDIVLDFDSVKRLIMYSNKVDRISYGKIKLSEKVVNKDEINEKLLDYLISLKDIKYRIIGFYYLINSSNINIKKILVIINGINGNKINLKRAKICYCLKRLHSVLSYDFKNMTNFCRNLSNQECSAVHFYIIGSALNKLDNSVFDHVIKIFLDKFQFIDFKKVNLREFMNSIPYDKYIKYFFGHLNIQIKKRPESLMSNIEYYFKYLAYSFIKMNGLVLLEEIARGSLDINRDKSVTALSKLITSFSPTLIPINDGTIDVFLKNIFPCLVSVGVVINILENNTISVEKHISCVNFLLRCHKDHGITVNLDYILSYIIKLKYYSGLHYFLTIEYDNPKILEFLNQDSGNIYAKCLLFKMKKIKLNFKDVSCIPNVVFWMKSDFFDLNMLLDVISLVYKTETRKVKAEIVDIFKAAHNLTSEQNKDLVITYMHTIYNSTPNEELNWLYEQLAFFSAKNAIRIIGDIQNDGHIPEERLAYLLCLGYDLYTDSYSLFNYLKDFNRHNILVSPREVRKKLLTFPSCQDHFVNSIISTKSIMNNIDLISFMFNHSFNDAIKRLLEFMLKKESYKDLNQNIETFTYILGNISKYRENKLHLANIIVKPGIMSYFDPTFLLSLIPLSSLSKFDVFILNKLIYFVISEDINIDCKKSLVSILCAHADVALINPAYFVDALVSYGSNDQLIEFMKVYGTRFFRTSNLIHLIVRDAEIAKYVFEKIILSSSQIVDGDMIISSLTVHNIYAKKETSLMPNFETYIKNMLYISEIVVGDIPKAIGSAINNFYSKDGSVIKKLITKFDMDIKFIVRILSNIEDYSKEDKTLSRFLLDIDDNCIEEIFYVRAFKPRIVKMCIHEIMEKHLLRFFQSKTIDILVTLFKEHGDVNSLVAKVESIASNSINHDSDIENLFIILDAMFSRYNSVLTNLTETSYKNIQMAFSHLYFPYSKHDDKLEKLKIALNDDVTSNQASLVLQYYFFQKNHVHMVEQLIELIKYINPISSFIIGNLPNKVAPTYKQNVINGFIEILSHSYPCKSGTVFRIIKAICDTSPENIVENEDIIFNCMFSYSEHTSEGKEIFDAIRNVYLNVDRNMYDVLTLFISFNDNTKELLNSIKELPCLSVDSRVGKLVVDIIKNDFQTSDTIILAFTILSTLDVSSIFIENHYKMILKHIINDCLNVTYTSGHIVYFMQIIDKASIDIILFIRNVLWENLTNVSGRNTMWCSFFAYVLGALWMKEDKDKYLQEFVELIGEKSGTNELMTVFESIRIYAQSKSNVIDSKNIILLLKTIFEVTLNLDDKIINDKSDFINSTIESLCSMDIKGEKSQIVNFLIEFLPSRQYFTLLKLVKLFYKKVLQSDEGTEKLSVSKLALILDNNELNQLQITGNKNTICQDDLDYLVKFLCCDKVRLIFLQKIFPLHKNEDFIDDVIEKFISISPESFAQLATQNMYYSESVVEATCNIVIKCIQKHKNIESDTAKLLFKKLLEHRKFGEAITIYKYISLLLDEMDVRFFFTELLSGNGKSDIALGEKFFNIESSGQETAYIVFDVLSTEPINVLLIEHIYKSLFNLFIRNHAFVYKKAALFYYRTKPGYFDRIISAEDQKLFVQCIVMDLMNEYPSDSSDKVDVFRLLKLLSSDSNAPAHPLYLSVFKIIYYYTLTNPLNINTFNCVLSTEAKNDYILRFLIQHINHSVEGSIRTLFIIEHLLSTSFFMKRKLSSNNTFVLLWENIEEYFYYGSDLYNRTQSLTLFGNSSLVLAAKIAAHILNYTDKNQESFRASSGVDLFKVIPKCIFRTLDDQRLRKLNLLKISAFISKIDSPDYFYTKYSNIEIFLLDVDSFIVVLPIMEKYIKIQSQVNEHGNLKKVLFYLIRCLFYGPQFWFPNIIYAVAKFSEDIIYLDCADVAKIFENLYIKSSISCESDKKLINELIKYLITKCHKKKAPPRSKSMQTLKRSLDNSIPRNQSNANITSLMREKAENSILLDDSPLVSTPSINTEIKSSEAENIFLKSVFRLMEPDISMNISMINMSEQ